MFPICGPIMIKPLWSEMSRQRLILNHIVLHYYIIYATNKRHLHIIILSPWSDCSPSCIQWPSFVFHSSVFAQQGLLPGWVENIDTSQAGFWRNEERYKYLTFARRCWGDGVNVWKCECESVKVKEWKCELKSVKVKVWKWKWRREMKSRMEYLVQLLYLTSGSRWRGGGGGS